MDNKERFIEIFTSQIHRPGAAELLEWLESTDFFEAPASTHYHGSYPGGLVEHSLNVYYELIGAGRVPGVPTAETYAVVALLHDICKADFYAQSTRNQKNSDGKWETVPCYTVREKFPFGHGEKSAFLVQRFMLLTDAEALAIANDTDYGLSALVLSGSSQRGEAMALQIESGRVLVNTLEHEHLAPFGGFKQSGLGREMGKWGLQAYLEPKTLLVG